MPRQFNTAGPNVAADHYTLPPLERLPPDAPELVEQGYYFVLHAPRQSGKTTAMLALADLFRQNGRYAVVFVSLEHAREIADRTEVIGLVVQALQSAAHGQLPPADQPPPEDPADAVMTGSRLYELLHRWAAKARPLVLIIDEIDCLQDDGLISVLSQLRKGYPERPLAFPHSVALFGMRAVRDYKVASGGSPNLGTSSPFNISREAMTVRFFTREDIATLYAQHTAETGQSFAQTAIDRVWALTRGQPWLVNALADRVVRKMGVRETVTPDDIDAAKEQLILERGTHFDSLAARLREDRVRRVIEPVLAGTLASDTLDDDYAYVRDLGLVDNAQPPGIHNPIYCEVVPRMLTAQAQRNMPRADVRWSRPDGGLDIEVVRHEFVEFWREHAEPFVARESYREVAVQLIVMAWLQRIVNGGGYIFREYAAGSGRIDVLIRWPLDGNLRGGPCENHLFELKAWSERHKKRDPRDQGLEQVAQYAARVPLASATLVIADRRTIAQELAWEDRVQVEAERPLVSGLPLAVIRV